MGILSKMISASVIVSLSVFAPVAPVLAQEEPAGGVIQNDVSETGEQMDEPAVSLEEFDEPAHSPASSVESESSMLAVAESGADSSGGLAYDKSDFYDDAGYWEGLSGALLHSGSRVASVYPMYLSDDMKYFAKYESSCNYDQGFSWGDGYHALGFYQFDHRHGLKEFLLACYAYDSNAYSMFGQFSFVSDDAFKAEDAIRQNGAFTNLGNSLNAAWHAAYSANPSEFAALQDCWAYLNYYLPAENYLSSRGIDISNRSDCVKGLCWGMANLFGVGGWRKFVGGVTSGYGWDGKWYSSYNWPGCGLDNSMSDVEFVTTLCNYVVDNVAIFYKAQPQYHQGWQNRYRNELKDCLSMIGSWVQEGSEWKYLAGNRYLTNTWEYIGEVWYWFDSNGYAANDGLQRVNGALYYFDIACRMHSDEWILDDGQWYWLSSSGSAVVNWQFVGGSWYWFDPSSAAMQTGWVRPDGSSWYYLAPSGAMQTDWQLLGGSWYHFDSSGAMQTGWVRPGGSSWYYLEQSGAMAIGLKRVGDHLFLLDGSGAMQTGWRELDGRWYHFSDWGGADAGWALVGGSWYWFDPSSAAMQTGWVRPDGSSWYYLAPSGAMQTDWQLLGGSWYHFDSSGAMQTGWVRPGGSSWYYLEQSGAMATGWILEEGFWYYLSGSGSMLTGWQSIGDAWYYLEPSGAMASDCWIDGCYLDKSGKWV